MLDFIDAYVAREHWPAILRAALIEGLFLLLMLIFLGVPLVAALGLIHLLTSIGGIILTIVTLSANAGATPDRAVPLARRAVATLLVSAAALFLLLLFL